MAARLGLFSTLTGPGSLQLVRSIALACRDGSVPGAAVAFLFVDREAGESADTDVAVAQLAEEFDFPVVRVSAVRFQPEARKAARAAAESGDEEPLWAWRDAWYATFADRLPATDLDLLLGDMWVWGRQECIARRGLNLHPAAPDGPKGKMWFDVIWDLVDEGATESGVMLHLVTSEVDEGPLVSFCRYPLRGGELDGLWGELPADPVERSQLLARERRLRRESVQPLFRAIRARGLAYEVPLMLATVKAVADGRLSVGHGEAGGLDLTSEVSESIPR